MHILVRLFICTVLFFAFVYAKSILVTRVFEEHFEGYCLSFDNETYFELGGSLYDLDSCVKTDCYQNAGEGKKYHLEEFRCPPVWAAPPCFIMPSKPGVPYPECCRRRECPID